MADPKENEIAIEVNDRSFIDFRSGKVLSQTSTWTEPYLLNANIQFLPSLPCFEESLFDQIDSYVPMKLKDNI